jgi:hypothetical protein
MSEAIVGTWRFLSYTDTRDSQIPGTYTFNRDGSGSFDLPNGVSLPLKWTVVGGRLRFGGPSDEEQSSVDFQFPSEETLMLSDGRGLGVIYERVRGGRTPEMPVS